MSRTKDDIKGAIIMAVLSVLLSVGLYHVYPSVFPLKSIAEDWKELEGTFEFAKKGSSKEGDNYFKIKMKEYEKTIYIGDLELEYFDIGQFNQEVSQGDKIFFLLLKQPSSNESSVNFDVGGVRAKNKVYFDLDMNDKANNYLPYKIGYWFVVFCDFFFLSLAIMFIFFPDKMKNPEIIQDKKLEEVQESPPESTETGSEKQIGMWKKRIGHNMTSMFLFILFALCLVYGLFTGQTAWAQRLFGSPCFGWRPSGWYLGKGRRYPSLSFPFLLSRYHCSNLVPSTKKRLVK